jgi:hypothetical protein
MSGEHNGTGYSPAHLSKEQVESLLQTLPGEHMATVYVDFLPNQPKTDQAREEFRELLLNKFNRALPDAVERMWDLPALILHRPNDEYVTLLIQARDLFTMGYFYSCVAMCGIVGERLVKDLLRASILLTVGGTSKRPTDEAFDQLERVDVSAIVRFLREAELISDDAKRAAVSLGDLRNQYAHARGKSPQVDALDSIKKLHILVEGTVSVLKDFEIVNGSFVAKSAL